MATRRKSRKKLPLVTNPFDAAKRKKEALLNLAPTKDHKKKNADAVQKVSTQVVNHCQTNGHGGGNNNTLARTPLLDAPTISNFPFDSARTQKMKPPIARTNSFYGGALAFDNCTQNTVPVAYENSNSNSISNSNQHHNNSNGGGYGSGNGFEFHDSNHASFEMMMRDDSNSQSWRQSKCANDSNGSHDKPALTANNTNFTANMFTQSAFLTPMDQPQQAHLSQIDVMNNRVFNYTKSKLNPTLTTTTTMSMCMPDVPEHDPHHQNGGSRAQSRKCSMETSVLLEQPCHDDLKTEYVERCDLQAPALNDYLDASERVDLLAYKKQQRGKVLNERYHRRYDELELLGNGSFGKVYKCRNRDDGCLYAVKKLKIQAIHKSNKQARQRAMKEGLILSSLLRTGVFCKNIVLYHCMWIEHAHFYLVTEYCDHGNLYNLHKLYASKPDELNESLFTKVLEDMCNALCFLHTHSFVHFDVKPENILLSKHGECKLADFGLCAKVKVRTPSDGDDSDEWNDDDDDDGNPPQGKHAFYEPEEGDARYLCRELIEGTYVASQLDKVDIFALGCSLYEIITCEDLPGNGFKWQQIRNGNLNWTPNRNGFAHQISSNMKQLIVSMMHSEPNERPPAQQLRTFLRRLSDKTLQQKDVLIDQLKNALSKLMQNPHIQNRTNQR